MRQIMVLFFRVNNLEPSPSRGEGRERVSDE